MIAAIAAVILGLGVWLTLKRKAIQPQGLPDYTQFFMTFRQKLVAAITAAAVLFAAGYLFYGNWAFACIAAPFSVFYPTVCRKTLREKRQRQLTLQFKHALQALSSALGAGKSLENAFREIVTDLQLLYPDPETLMIREIVAINHQVENKIPLEQAFARFSRRSGVEDILQFGEVLATCKRTGGDMIGVVRRASEIIGDKLDMEQEISVMIAQKRFESKVLTLAPLAVIALLRFSSFDYMQPLYAGFGHLIMTSALLLLALSFWLTKKMMRLKV